MSFGAMFADIDADVYVMVDGDDTYDAAAAPRLIRELVDNDLDIVIGCAGLDRVGRLPARPPPRQRVLTALVRVSSAGSFTDMLSGYRCSRARFVKSFPALSSGFEIETELTVHALELRMPSPRSRRPTRSGRRARSASSAPSATAGGSSS